MGDEATQGAQVGTKLIMFVAIIGLVLVAFLVGKNLINKGVDSMETSAQTIDESRFSDYNGKTVRGRAVKTAIDNFTNDDVAILVNTLAMNDSDGTTKLAKVQSESGATIVTMSGVSAYNNNGTSLNQAKYINYCALLTASTLTCEDGEIVYDDDFNVDANGNINRYTVYSNMSKKGQVEYIADSSSFTSTLIKNKSHEIVGIVFTQRYLK